MSSRLLKFGHLHGSKRMSLLGNRSVMVSSRFGARTGLHLMNVFVHLQSQRAGHRTGDEPSGLFYGGALLLLRCVCSLGGWRRTVWPHGLINMLVALKYLTCVLFVLPNRRTLFMLSTDVLMRSPCGKLWRGNGIFRTSVESCTLGQSGFFMCSRTCHQRSGCIRS